MPRGGKRNGAPGVAYPRRSDLNAVKPLPPTAAPGQGYGMAGQQLAAQAAVPMAPPASPQAAPAAGPAPSAGPVPGAVPFDRGTERPGEPVTAGLPIGPGPGPQPGFGGQPMPGNLAGLLGQMASAPGAPSEIQALMARLNSGHQ